MLNFYGLKKIVNIFRLIDTRHYPPLGLDFIDFIHLTMLLDRGAFLKTR